jgi:Predicted integral membrane protein (DUF2269)
MVPEEWCLPDLPLEATPTCRQLRDLPLFAEAIRNSAVFYDGIVAPGALLLPASGAWLIIEFFGGWDFLQVPWLAGMVALFAFEFMEGNTVTRLYFMRLRRLTAEALTVGDVTPELEKARAEHLPTFTHFLDMPMLFLIAALGAIRPNAWGLFFGGLVAAVLVAAFLTVSYTATLSVGAGWPSCRTRTANANGEILTCCRF